MDVAGAPVILDYSPQFGTIAFGVAGRVFLTAAPPGFRDLWTPLVCAGAR